MRCSDCLGEMIENNGFVECTSCGRILQAVLEEPEESFMDRLSGRLAIPSDALPVPLPIVVAGAALVAITSAVLLNFSLSGEAPGADTARNGAASAALATATLGNQQTGPWLTQVTALPAASLLVSAAPGSRGFAVVMQRGDLAPEDGGGMQVAYLDADGTLDAEIRPILPGAWLLTHAIPTGTGDVTVLGQTADGLFLFRIDREGQPVWGRFEGADGTISSEEASLLRTGDMLVISAPMPRGLGLGLIAYDLDGRRLWSESIPGVVTGSYALAGTPSGELVLAGAIASDGGRAEQRFIRLDRTGTVQVDVPLALPDGNRAQRAAVALDDSVYLVSAGQAALIQRFSPRGTEQWQAALSDWPKTGNVAGDLIALPNGAAVTRLDAGTLHAVRITGSGLDLSTSAVPMPEGLVALGTRIRQDGQVMAVIMADPTPASPRLVHAQADLRDLFRRAGDRGADGPMRTVGLDDVAAGRDEQPPAFGLRPGAGAAGARPEIRGASDAPPLTRPAVPANTPAGVGTASGTAPGTRAQPATAPASQPSQGDASRLPSAECTFICMPEGVPAAKYPVSQSYDITSSRSLNDITLDAFADHDGICRSSGGLAHAGSVPVCRKS